VRSQAIALVAVVEESIPMTRSRGMEGLSIRNGGDAARAEE
jgi:hypothetical protein